MKPAVGSRQLAVALLLIGTVANAKPVEDWRAKAPKPGPEPAAPLPVIERAELPNGLVLLVHARHDLPYVFVDAVVAAGDDAQPPGKEGLASLTAEMLQTGTAARDAQRIADDAALLGADLQSDSASDSTHVELGALKPDLARAVELVGDLVTHPSFPVDELEKARARRLSQILERADDPAEAIRDVMAAVAYGEGHPYAPPHFGTAESVGKLTRADLVGFYQARYRPGGAAIVFVGDVTLAEARQLVERGPLGAWPRAQATPIVPAQPAKPPVRGIVLVDKAGAPQSEMGFVLLTAPATDADHAALDLADACLGRTFSSRLNLNLREEHGYSYGAFSNIRWQRGPSLWLSRAAIRTDVTLPAIGEIRNELRKLAADPPSDAELSVARAQLIHGVVGEFETTREAAGAIGDLFILGLPLDWFQKYAAAVGKLTRDEVARAIRKHLLPERAAIVVIGDRSRIEPALEVQHRDASGRVIR